MIDNTYSGTTGNTITVTTPSTINNIQLNRELLMNYANTKYILSF